MSLLQSCLELYHDHLFVLTSTHLEHTTKIAIADNLKVFAYSIVQFIELGGQNGEILKFLHWVCENGPQTVQNQVHLIQTFKGLSDAHSRARSYCTFCNSAYDAPTPNQLLQANKQARLAANQPPVQIRSNDLHMLYDRSSAVYMAKRASRSQTATPVPTHGTVGYHTTASGHAPATGAPNVHYIPTTGTPTSASLRSPIAAYESGPRPSTALASLPSVSQRRVVRPSSDALAATSNTGLNSFPDASSIDACARALVRRLAQRNHLIAFNQFISSFIDEATRIDGGAPTVHEEEGEDGE